MKTTRSDADPPRTLTFRGDDMHLLLRELIYAVSTVEAVQRDVLSSADKKRDQWVVVNMQRLDHVVKAVDKALELLGQADDKPSRT